MHPIMEEERIVLRTEGLVKRYGKRTVVNDVSFDVKQGEIVGLLGPNGAGKTTLIKKLIAEAFEGEQLVLIENEFGEIGIDGGFLKEAGVNITEMNSGCICCSLVGDFGSSLKDVVEKYHPDRIIIEDDSCPFYKMPRSPKINLIRIAEKRAEILNAEFITGGRMPSGYIYKKYAPDEILKPERKNIILADVNDKKIFNENIKGIEGNLKITRSILKRSIKNIISGKNVFWILNRYGEAAEIKCDNCGNILTCKKCGAKLRVTDSGEKSECPECGDVKKIPDKTPKAITYIFFC